MDSLIQWLDDTLIRTLLTPPPMVFEAWNNAVSNTLTLDPFWGFVVSSLLAILALALTALSGVTELWYISRILNRTGSLARNIMMLAIFSVITPLMFAVGFVAMFAPGVHTLGDFAAFLTLAALWIVPMSLISEAVILVLLLREERNSVRLQI